MRRTKGGERLLLGNKPIGQRVVGFSGPTSGAGKRNPSIPSVTGAPSFDVPGANQALPGKGSRGLSTNFGARGIAPFRPGSKFGIKLSVQPLTSRRSLPFLEVGRPVDEFPTLPGFMPEDAPGRAPVKAINPGTMNKLTKTAMRQR